MTTLDMDSIVARVKARRATGEMTLDQAHDACLANIDAPHGRRFAETIGRFQEGFIRDRVTRDVDEAFRRAVDATMRLLPAIKAKSAKPEDLRKALQGARFEGGWNKAMTGGAVQFDKTGLNTLSVPVMVQWRNKELVTVWPADVAKAKAVWPG